MRVRRYREARQQALSVENASGRKYPAVLPEPSLAPIHTYNEPVGRGYKWDWPYPVAIFRYTYLNSWTGNQVPGFEKDSMQGAYAHSWVIPTTQQAQEYQRVGSKSSTGMGAFNTQQLLQQVAAAWQKQT